MKTPEQPTIKTCAYCNMTGDYRLFIKKCPHCELCRISTCKKCSTRKKMEWAAKNRQKVRDYEKDKRKKNEAYRNRWRLQNIPKQFKTPEEIKKYKEEIKRGNYAYGQKPKKTPEQKAEARRGYQKKYYEKRKALKLLHVRRSKEK
jgi:hypothetical protein